MHGSGRPCTESPAENSHRQIQHWLMVDVASAAGSSVEIVPFISADLRTGSGSKRSPESTIASETCRRLIIDIEEVMSSVTE